MPGGTILQLIGADNAPIVELNDAGEVMFWAMLDGNREGLFVTTIPEPTAMTLLGLAGLGGIVRRRRRC